MGNNYGDSAEKRDIRNIKNIYNYINCSRILHTRNLTKILDDHSHSHSHYIDIIFTNESLLFQILQKNKYKLFELLLSFNPNLSGIIDNSSKFEPSHTVNNEKIIYYIISNGTCDHLKLIESYNIDMDNPNIVNHIDREIKLIKSYEFEFNLTRNKKLQQLYENKNWILNDSWKSKFLLLYKSELFDIKFRNMKYIIKSYLI